MEEDELLITQIRNTKEQMNNTSLEKILTKMQPLVKKYIRKLYYMEKDDAAQELNLALIEAVHHIQKYENEAMCLTYLQKSVINKYFFLCKLNKTKHIYSEFSEISDDIPYYQNFEDIELYNDMNELLKNKNEKQNKIIKYVLLDNLSDSEISLKMGISRQYVNRIKKKILKDYFSNKS